MQLSNGSEKGIRRIQPLHKIVSLANAGATRKADVFLDLDCNLFRVCYIDGMENNVWQAFPCQDQAETSASAFIHFGE